MQVRNYFFSQLDRKKKLTAREFFLFKIRLALILLIWLIFAITIVGYWSEINIFLKILFIAYCSVFAPGLDTVEQLFLSFKKYEREGL